MKTAALTLTTIAVLLLSFCSGVQVHAAASSAAPSWTIQTVDSNVADGSASLLVLDSNGNPHIAYTEYFYPNNNNYPLTYASWTGTSWNTQQISTYPYDETVSGVPEGLVLDSNNNPQIIFNWENMTNGLMYASWNGEYWAIQTIDPQGTPYTGSLALDSAGNLHVAYFADGVLKYASLTGTTWNIQTVDASETTFTGSHSLSFALNSNTPYIMYGYQSYYLDKSTNTNYTTDIVRLATYENSGWSIQTVALPFPIDSFGNMVVDSNGYAHFTCIQSSPPFTLIYVSWNGSVSNTQHVTGSNLRVLLVSDPGSLALDSHGYPHIYVPCETSAYVLTTIYASWTGTKWNIQTAPGDNSGDGPLVLDSNGNPHITYLGVSNASYYSRTCYYATVVELTSTPTPPSTSVSSPTSSAYALLIVLAAVVVVVAVVGVVYVWRKKK